MSLAIVSSIIASAQHAELMIERELFFNTLFRYAAFSWGSGESCLVGSQLGLLSSNDGGQSFRFTTSPTQNAKLEYGMFCGYNKRGIVVVAGYDLAFVGNGTVLNSQNRGGSWSEVDAALNDSIGWRLRFKPLYIGVQEDGWARILEWYSSNGGLNWRKISMPEGVSLGDWETVDYLDSGRFVYRVKKDSVWYESVPDSSSMQVSSVPFSLLRVSRTISGTDVGYSRVGSRYYLMERQRGQTVFSPIDSTSIAGIPLDSLSIVDFRPSREGGIVILGNIRGGGGKTYAVVFNFDGNSWKGWNASEIDSNVVSIDRIIDISEHLVLASCKTEALRSQTLLFDLDSSKLSLHDLGLLGLNADLLSGESILDASRGGRFVRYDPETKKAYRIGKLIGEEYGRESPLSFVDVVNSAESAWSLTVTGDVYAIEDTHLVVRNTYQGFQSNGTTFTSHTIFEILPFGASHLWHTVDGAVTGGTKVVLNTISGSIPADTLWDDTATAFATSGSNKDQIFVGYRNINRSDNNGQTWTELAQLDSALGPISSIVPVGYDTILVGAHGYEKRVSGKYADSTLYAGGIWRTEDGGNSWIQDQSFPNHSYVASIQRRESDGRVWACMISDVTQKLVTDTFSLFPEDYKDGYSEQGDIVLVSSSDNGSTWHLVRTQSYSGEFQPTTGSVSFWGDRTVVWTTHDRVSWSDDNGETWRDVTGLPSYPYVISSARFDNDGNLMIATGKGIYKVSNEFVSVDEPREIRTPIFWANAFPNPSTKRVTVRVYNLDRTKGEVQHLKIVDLFGNTIVDLKHLIVGNHKSGSFDFEVDLGSVSNGAYFLVGSCPARAFTWPMWVVN